MRTKRQNIQLELALEPAAKGEARSAGAQGTEARTSRAGPERPAAGQGPSVEAVVEPGNLKKALARARRNKGAPAHDEPLDPASRSGGLDEQVQPVAVGVAS